MTRLKSSVSPGVLQAAIVLMGLVIVAFIWVLDFQQHRAARTEAFESKAAEHLNLATIIAEHLNQLADRSKAVSQVFLADNITLTNEQTSLSRVLAKDPIFRRLSLYTPQGRWIYNSHDTLPAILPAHWLEQVRHQATQHGFRPFLPTGDSSGPDAIAPKWHLPLLLPVADHKQADQLSHIMLIEMDVGYLASMYQNINLGWSGVIQLLDARGDERLRADTSGVIFSGGALVPGPAQPIDTLRGQYRSVANDQLYQSLYASVPEHGWRIVVSQRTDEILGPAIARSTTRFWLSLVMTLAILIGISWIFKALRRQQAAMLALQQSEHEKLALIENLETAHRRSSHAASTDHLSGLYNRREFIKVASETLQQQRNKRRLLAVLFIDLDRFKTINDTLGHKIGDLLLQAVAGRIQRLLGPDDTAARFGGDEFVVMLAGSRTEQQITDWVKILNEKLSATYSLEGTELVTSPSVGIAICPRDAQDIDALIRCADAAMYSAKRAGRGQFRFFDPSLNTSRIEEFHIEQAMGDALKKRQFILHYQPKINLDNLAVSGFEALVRWRHPEFGLIYPDRFISVAERSGFIINLGMEVLRLACEQLREWQAMNIHTTLSVNVSALQLGQDDFSDAVLNMLAEHDIAPALIELEITETAILDREQLAIQHLEKLKSAGLEISLDDFGLGYAGFAHLYSLPISKLKIDRGLITQLSNAHDDSPIVSSTIALAKRLSLQVVAEGVETREQLVYLKTSGCDFGQGYHFSRPVAADKIPEFLATFNGMQPASGKSRHSPI
ncbi:MAG: EAL domain-containing protein [Pusillimonas sp.]